MTDNEITVKALKELLEVMLCEGDLQRVSTVSHAIEHINRLQEKNSNLTSDLTSLQNDLTSAMAEIEKYDKIKTMLDMFWDVLLKIGMAKRKEKPTLEEFAEALQEIKDNAKVEAHKEFAERLEPKLANNTDISAVGYQSVIDDIESLIKEMDGENND